MSPEQIRVEEVLAITLNKDQLVLEGLEMYIQEKRKLEPIPQHDEFIDDLRVGYPEI